MKKDFLSTDWLSNISLVKKLYIIVGIFLFAIIAMMAMSKFEMDTLSALRGYVGAEGLWTKAQKDAIYSLMNYNLSGDDKYYQRFQESLKLPLGDKKVRLELEKRNSDMKIVRAGFLEGKNAPEDLDGFSLKNWYNYWGQATRRMRV